MRPSVHDTILNVLNRIFYKLFVRLSPIFVCNFGAFGNKGEPISLEVRRPEVKVTAIPDALRAEVEQLLVHRLIVVLQFFVYLF